PGGRGDRGGRLLGGRRDGGPGCGSRSAQPVDRGGWLVGGRPIGKDRPGAPEPTGRVVDPWGGCRLLRWAVGWVMVGSSLAGSVRWGGRIAGVRGVGPLGWVVRGVGGSWWV